MEKQKRLLDIEPRKPKFKPKKKPRYELSCGVIIFHIYKKEPHYLLLKYPTYWGFVKGIVEPGEDEEKTAFREADEEAGITDLYFIPGFRVTQKWYYRDYDNKQLVRKEGVFLLARTKSWKVKISHEHEDYKWCKHQEAMKLMRVRATRQLLTRAHNTIIKQIGKL
jgi:8-oxo-dGTP pyrophosphatase MutT (NUDIX family)